MLNLQPFHERPALLRTIPHRLPATSASESATYISLGLPLISLLGRYKEQIR
jgi:hypothetical protein